MIRLYAAGMAAFAIRSRRLAATLVAAVLAWSGAAPPTLPVLARASEAQAIAAPSPERARMNRRVFDRVWDAVRRHYYDPGLHGVDWPAARQAWRPRALAATDDTQLYAALSGMLDLLDDTHAAARPPVAIRRQENQRRSRAVLGLMLTLQSDDLWRIEQVRAGSPAEDAGLEAGWRLRALDGRPWTPETEVFDGQPVQLDLLDEAGDPRRAQVTPRVMPPPAIFSADRSRPGVLVLDVDGFEPGLGRWAGEQLKGLDPAVRVVLDLRGNPGGHLAEAEALLACFLPLGRTWAVQTSRQGRAFRLRIEGGCGDLPGSVANPLAVLVDDASRSAAELTPAALQEAGRAVVAGERTRGAVLIAQDLPLPDGGRLMLSHADFITAGGIRLEKRGVRPDVEATGRAADRRLGLDAPLAAALAALDLAALSSGGRSVPTEH